MNMQDKIAAQVAGKPIMESEIDETLMKMGQRGQSYNNPQGRATSAFDLTSTMTLYNKNHLLSMVFYKKEECVVCR